MRHFGAVAWFALALALVAVVVTTAGESRAQSPDGLSVTLSLAVPKLPEVPKEPKAPLPVEPPAVPVEPPSVPVEPPAVPVEPPAVPVDPPSVPVDPPSLPRDTPTVPTDPPRVPVDPPSVRGLRLPGGATDALPAQPSAPAGAPALEPASGSASLPAPGADVGAAFGAAELPSRSQLAALPPAQRREVLRTAFDAPLRGEPLRRLRAAIRTYPGCLAMLSERGRRALQLRAGLLGQAPASRRAIGRRLGISPEEVLRLERASLRMLGEAGRSGVCSAAAVTSAWLGNPPAGLAGPDAGAASDAGGPDGAAPGGGVLAEAREGGGDPGIDFGDGRQSAAETLVFLLLALTVLAAPLAFAAWRRRAGAATVAAGRRSGQRPLLFLDVDGVITLDPLASGLPPGRMRESPHGLSYLPHRTRELVRELADRFEIVWASGWEHRANAELAGPLGLDEELPVLTFGNKARDGSASWKTKPIGAYAADRPLAWLDDNFARRHRRWAARRSAPTLLVEVDPAAGLTADHVERLERWADGVAGTEATRPDPARSEPRRARARESARG